MKAINTGLRILIRSFFLKHLIPTAKLKVLLKRLFLIAIPKNTMILLRFQLLKSTLKKTGFVNATADYTLISIVKTNDTYSLMPTFNDFERGPLVIDDDERIILANYQKGELAEIMKDFIQIYVKANMFYKEKQELEEEKKRRENN